MNIQKVIMLIQVIIKMRPLIIELIELAELMFPGDDNGAGKREFVKSYVKALFDSLEEIKDNFDDAWPVIDGFIAATVAAFNRLGKFKTSKPLE